MNQLLHQVLILYGSAAWGVSGLIFMIWSGQDEEITFASLYTAFCTAFLGPLVWLFVWFDDELSH